MATPRNFAHYPAPCEVPADQIVYRKDSDKNPALRGLGLVVGANLIANFPPLQKLLWSNAKFGTIKDMPGLESQVRVLDPVVIPLADGSEPVGPLALDPANALGTPHPPDLGGRYLSAADFHAAYRSGAVTPLQVVEAILPLISRGEDGPASASPGEYANAWVSSHGRADLALEAARASTVRWARGEPLGPLDGVPIGVKDDVDVAGYVSHYGMRRRAEEPFFAPAAETTWPVRKLEEAGAVVVGKTNMHELGSDTSGLNLSWGTPTNWHNPAYYPGGSSSGSASALCAGVVPIGVCTDAGGSIRMPASFNGVYGLKPSHHRTVVMNSSMCVTGPMAANVADLTLAYRAMAQPDPECPVRASFAPSVPPSPGARRVIGIYQDWWTNAAAPVAEVCRAAVDHFRAAGYEVIDVSIPHLREASIAHAATILTEMADGARGRTADPRRWLDLVNHGNKVLLTVGSQTDGGSLIKYGQLRAVVMRHVAHLFRAHPGLLVVTPTSPLAGWPIHPGDHAHGFSDTNVSVANMCYVFLANTTGCPAVTCPVGYVAPEQGSGRIPVGLMAMGEWGAEEQLLAWAGECESYLHAGGRIRPDGWIDVLELAKGKVGSSSDAKGADRDGEASVATS